MSIDEYLNKFNKLEKYSHFQRAPLTEEDLMFKFQRGLHDNISEKLAGHSSDTFMEIISKFKYIQEYYRKKNKDQATSKSSPKNTSGNSKGKCLQVKQSDGKFKKAGNSKSGNFKSSPQCSTCGKIHSGVSRKEQRLCYKCDQVGHFIKDCPFNGGQVSTIQATPAPMVVEEPSLPLPPPFSRVYAMTQQEAESKTIYVSSNDEERESPYLSVLRVVKALKEGDSGFILFVGLVGINKEPISDIPIVSEFEDVFLDEIPHFPLEREIEFSIDLLSGKANVVADALSRKALCIANMMISKYDFIEKFRDLNIPVNTEDSSYLLTITVVQNSLVERLKEAQLLDEEVQSMKEQDFVSTDTFGLKFYKDRIIVSKGQMVDEVLAEAHMGMAPYEALYGRRCRAPTSWSEIGERQLFKPDMVQENTDQIIMIKDRLKKAQSRKRLRKYVHDASNIVQQDDIKVKKDLKFVVGPLKVLARDEKVLRNRVIPMIKVQWEGSSEILCIPSERDALLRFKHHLQDPSNRLSSWNASNPNCCHWEGVVCSNNLTAHILQLHLNTSVPDYYLYPDFHDAYERSRFSGETLQALPSLMELRLPACTLNYYKQPSTVNFSSLITLDLSDTNSFVPKWIFELRKIVSLNLRGNNIQVSIPDGIQNLTLLENLDLSENSFSIPDWLYSLHHLKFLDLGWNNLHGTISDDLGNLTSLVGLDLSVNQLEGKIPSSLGNLTSLVRLDLSNNSIRGALPTSFAKLSSLRNLDLSKNQFHGNPFEVLKSLSKLSYLNIDDNLFQGVVKEDDLANLSSLTEFCASGNNLTLKVGPNWHPTFQVIELRTRSWQLGSNFPSWIQSQKDLRILDMSNTGISDSIPTWFWETVSHASVYVNLSHNHIHSELANTLKYPISTEIIDLSSNHLHGKLPHLSHGVIWLDLSSNSFSGSLTDLLCQKQDEPMLLEFFNLGANNLSGEIPNCWIIWPDLMDVNLQRNRFVGYLPPSMGSLAKLDSLNIHNNSLSGIFPPILKNTTKLISLDLGENKLTGIIPAWVGKRLINLKILRLRSNRFLGHIPNQICDMIFLQDLDLAQNNLSGNIPKCFNHLNAMLLKNRITTLIWAKGRGIEYRNLLGMVTNVDLSNNNLSGGIPREITSLDGLIYLNLSKNQLTGQIPQSIGNMRSLESIDFSRNRLSGEIPSTMSNLSFLSKLDLSYNHLRGEIPIGTQLQSFEASNFVDNNLCGPPLPINCSSNRQIPDDDHKGKKNDGHNVNGFFVSMTFGFYNDPKW
ncbi:receptor-like protein EIX2 [Gastrolobium bilobum]|uniref:receptor-like protein EIX2 n=1 Tax=Gastrolobium bilobum TaxID=150636 RepID=UPI002AB2B992|nr:receptor-like protein EIX2 [Gastrolobium bilobum]